MVLCDTNIFIHAFNGNPTTITALTRIGTAEIVISAITYKLPLFTYNVRNFNFIPDIILHEA